MSVWLAFKTNGWNFNEMLMGQGKAKRCEAVGNSAGIMRGGPQPPVSADWAPP